MMTQPAIVSQTRTRRARNLVARTRTQRFGVGAFNADNLETITAIARAARAQRSPVLIEASASEVAVIGLANLRAIADNAIDDYGIELYLNLDHAPSVHAALAALDAGFEFVHLDLTAVASTDEIIEATREVVAAARETGALVEGELSAFSGSSTVHHDDYDLRLLEPTLTDPDEAKSFVDATGIDILSVAIGNLHGHYPSYKRLDFDRLRRIRTTVDCALSLHGGSGTALEDYMRAIANGISKININSDLRKAFRDALEDQFINRPDEYALAKLVGPAIDATQRVVESKLRVFGGGLRARPFNAGAIA